MGAGMTAPESPTATMRAVTCPVYGPPEVLRLARLPRPVPGPGEVLVRVAAAGVTAADARLRAASAPPGFGPLIRLAFGLRRPRRLVPGREFAGRVEGLGPGARGFAPGDAVMGITDGMRLGAHADYLCVKADGLIRSRPATLGSEEAAGFFFGGLTAADFLIDQARLQAGERLLVIGATGAVGSAAVQMAAHAGARVTAVAGADNLALARSLGAEAAHDYRTGLPTGSWDVILDVPGVLPRGAAVSRLAPGGRLALVTASLGATIGAALRPKRGAWRVCAGVVKESGAAIDRLLALHAAGAYRPVIGAALPLERIVEASRLAGSFHKRGNLVVTLD